MLPKNTSIPETGSYVINGWGFNCTRIKTLQKKAVRVIYNSKYNAHTSNIFKQLTQLAKYLGPMWFLLGLCRAQVPHVKPTWVCNGPSGPRCPMLCPLGCLLGYMDDTNCVIKLGFNWVIWAEHA